MKLKHLLLLLMILVSFSTARAATDGSDFKFNDGVRYSQWAINSRLNSFCANTANMGLAVYDENGNTILKREDGGKTKLDYVPGLVAKGIIEAVKYYQQYTWAAPWVKPWFLSVADYGNKWYNVSEAGGSLDDLNGVKLYMPLSELASTGGAFPDNTAYNNAVAAIGHAVNGLKAHNDTYVIGNGTLAGDNVAGGWWHKAAYNNQMWLDGQYMGPALLAQIINHNKSTANISADDWKIIIRQLDAVWQICWNSTDKLMYHAFEANGGTETTFSHAEVWSGLSASNLHSASYWGRACGWYFLALVDILHEMDNAKSSSQNTYTNDDYTRIKSYLTSLAEGLKARQDTETGGWYQILDKDSKYSASEYNNGQSHTQTYNYIESSATTIFAAAYLKAIRLGYLAESEYGETARNAYKCIVNNFFAADGKDGVHIFGSCRSAGLGSDKTDGTALAGKKNFRDGSNEYYLLGYDVTRVAKSDNETEGKVLGAFILASTEYEQLYQKDNILFSKDLAPAYTLSGSDNFISMEAFGADNIEYRWYNINDGSTVVSTTPTFTPAESGSYYCTATAGGKTITSSTANVTVIAQIEANNTIKFSLSNINDESGNIASGDDYIITEATLIGGTAFVHNGKASAATMVTKNSGINLNGSGNSYLCVTLDQPLSAGDVITIDDGTTTGTMYITATASKSGATVKTLSYNITESDGLSGQQNLYFWKDGIKSLKTLTITTSSSTCTISYNTNGHGAAPEAKTVAKGYTLTETDLPVLTADGYTFEGWYTDAECMETNKAAVSTVIEGNITLYAKWTQNSAGNSNKIELTAAEAGKSTTWTKDGFTVKFNGTGQSNYVKLPKNSTFDFTIPDGCSVESIEITYGTSTSTYGDEIATVTLPGGTTDFSVSTGNNIVVTNTSGSDRYISKIVIKYTSTTLKTSDLHILGTGDGETSNYVNNSNAWTPAVGGTIALSELVTSSSAGMYSVSTGDAATLNADGTTLTAVKNGTITLSQAVAGEYTSGSVDINIAIGDNVTDNTANAYTFPTSSETVVSDGMTIALKDITMTFGNDGFWKKAGTNNGYTSGQNGPKPGKGAVPTSGTYYTFKPKKDGSLAVNISIGTDKQLYVVESDGTPIDAKDKDDNVVTGSASATGYTGYVTFNVAANKTYCVYADGSRANFYGFTFKPSAESPIEGKVIATFEKPNDNKDAKSWIDTEKNTITIERTGGNLQLEDNNTAVRVGTSDSYRLKLTIPSGATMTAIKLEAKSSNSSKDATVSITGTGISETLTFDAGGDYAEKTLTFDPSVTGQQELYLKASEVNAWVRSIIIYGEDKTAASNSNATFKYDGSDLTFTETADKAYEATIEVGADKKNTTLDINVSTVADAEVVCDNGGTVSGDKTTITVKVPASIDSPETYTVTVTSADGTSTTTYKITVKLKKQAIVLKYVLNDDSEDATEERKANAEWFWDKLKSPKEFTANTLVLHAYLADSKGNATTEEIELPTGMTYESDMPSVATVDKENGTITPVGSSLGRAYIYATLKNAEYEAEETRCAVYIRDGYTYNAVNEDSNFAPGINTFKYITTTNDASGDTGDQLLRMKFGGWKYNGGKYIKPSVCQGSKWTSTNNNDYVTDSWGKPADSGVTGIDGFTKGFAGANDACDESMQPSTHYNSTRYGWFKAPSDDKNNLYDPNNITETSPFTLPVRGAYMTFEPMVNGTLSVFIIQNGAWNTWNNSGTYKENGVEYTYGKGDIKKGEFRPHSFQVVNQRGLTLSQFSTKWSVDTKQSVTSKYYCVPDDDTHSGEGILSPNVADWPEFNDGRLTDGERADIVAAWKGGPRGMQNIVMLHDGSFLAIEKGIVKYTFHVTGHETYYFFSNFSKMGFCGVNFTPDTESAQQPTATLELDDEVAYPTFTVTKDGEYEGNPEMRRYNVDTEEFESLPKINKHTFTIENAMGTNLDKINVEGAQAPQFKEIIMNRTFKKGQWNTLCVPFNMTQRKVEEIFGVGTQLILLEKANIKGNVVKLHFLYHEIQNVLPGYPYLIKPTLTYKKDGLYVNDSYSDGDAYKTEDGVRIVNEETGELTKFVVPVKHINPIITQREINCGDYITTGTPGYCTADKEINVGGTIHKVSVVYGDGDVFLSDGDGKLYVSIGASYGKGYRAYIKKISPAQVKSISMEYSGVEDGGESIPTEIKFTELAPEAAMTLGFRGVYSLSGQKVAETTEGLPAGIYIVNGQKMVVR